MRNLILLFSAAAIIAPPGSAQARRTESLQRVTVDWLASRMRDTSLALVHVVTDQSEYDAGHVPGSVPMPVSAFAILGSDSLRAELPAPVVLRDRLEAAGVADGRDIVVIGQPVAAARFAFTLATLGLEPRVRFLDGGIEAWREWAATRGAAATLVTRTPATGRPRARLTITPQPTLVASVEDVRGVIASTASDRARILDARAVEFYSGASPGAMPRAGHIPTAGNVPLTGLTGVNGLLRAPADVRALIAASTGGRGPGSAVITYCHIGMQASLLWLQARLAGYEARVFDGSWQAWARDRSLPIEGQPAAP
jgi:thiosulfate/3-mercaptopyruvate sulfurtransferase